MHLHIRGARTEKGIRMSVNIDNAIALLKTYETGDAALAESLLTEDVIQHNNAYFPDRDGFVRVVRFLKDASEPSKVEIVRVFEDGDKVFLHSAQILDGRGPRAVFNVFRFNGDGKVCEMWDNLDDRVGSEFDHAQVDGPTEAAADADTEASRKLAEGFVRDFLVADNYDAADAYLADGALIQHNPAIADGGAGWKEYLDSFKKYGLCVEYQNVGLVLAQGNFALVGTEGRLRTRPTTFYDLFRIENGKIVEHWDTVETLGSGHTFSANGKF